MSDPWLVSHGGKEKSFSLGAFDPDYLSRHHIAVARQGGHIIAFANIWTNAGGKRATLDLMRFDPERAPNGVMDFLFTEMLLWAQAQGFESFDLGMAPLAGLASDQVRLVVRADRPAGAPVWRNILWFRGPACIQGQVRPALGAALHCCAWRLVLADRACGGGDAFKRRRKVVSCR